MSSPPLPDLSVVVPMLDERAVVDRLVAALRTELDGLGLGWELVCIDDGSTDGTGERLDELALDLPQLVAVRLSRNFGKEAALAAGLDVARGRAVVLMDADLQHPPELLGALVRAWQEGAEVVNAVKADRGRESLAYTAAARAFYGLMGGALDTDLRRASDYKLLDRQVVDVLATMDERNRFFRGLVAWVGFSVVEIPFTVAERAGGETKWGLAQLLRYSLRSLVAFSSLPLRAISWLGFATTAFALLLGLQTLWNWVRGAAVDGFTTTILAVLIMGGAVLVCLGVIATYLAAIYEEIKARPIYVLRRPRRASSAQASSSAPAAEESPSPAARPAGQ